VKLQVVGRNPPTQMVKKYHHQRCDIEFTGFVDDVRDYVWNAAVYIMPLRVGSGTRIKAFEAMAMGCPVVSTTLGVEGLGLEPGKHYLCADSPDEFSRAVCRLLQDKGLRETLSMNARRYVEENFSSQIVSDKFESICIEAINLKQT
jgi:glycosyltransferase involved in cell wall biosynthesis